MLVATTSLPPRGVADILHALPVAAWSMDAAGGTSVNERLRELLGPEAHGPPWEGCVDPQDLAQHAAAWRAAWEARAPFQSEWRVRRPDGAPAWVQERAAPRSGPEGFAGYVGCLVDVSEAHRMRERVREADQARAMLVNAASHELRTPLTPLLMQLQLLATRPDLPPDKVREGVKVALRSAERLQALVNDLLNVSRIEKDVLAAPARPFDLQALVQDVARSFAIAARVKGVRVETPDGPPLAMLGDPRRLGQVVGNLLSNAIRFTPGGGTVTAQAWQDEAHVGLRVADTGAGFDPRRAGELFQPFRQLHDGALVGGTGLGLFICRNVVRAHGGEITAQSGGPGTGATFDVRFPRRAAGDAASSTAAGAATPTGPDGVKDGR